MIGDDDITVQRPRTVSGAQSALSYLVGAELVAILVFVAIVLVGRC